MFPTIPATVTAPDESALNVRGPDEVMVDPLAKIIDPADPVYVETFTPCKPAVILAKLID